MAARKVWKILPTNYFLITTLRAAYSSRWTQLKKNQLHLRGLQAAQRTYSTGSSSKESSAESGEDPKNKPIRFSTSRARHMTLNQTLGIGQIEIEKNPSKKSIYIGMVLMAIMTYIIFFLPPDQDELDLLELEIEKYEREQAKRQ
ncbi:unnamed protein product [Porites lobata]|uniref:Uncharacterized protein n=1 Tax=Porites lobata TaxID=104759 RepID=A0ABN8PH08_9CNID|nr:unnamed protein product [Porites lobata]